jgi:hypothetical protein
MKAITIKQPLAQHIIFGDKRIENRSWKTSYRGRLVIHVGKGKDLSRPLVEGHEEQGKLLGTVELIAILSREDALMLFPDQEKWICGPWCWVLRNPKAFEKSISYKGKLSIYDIPDSLIQ